MPATPRRARCRAPPTSPEPNGCAPGRASVAARGAQEPLQPRRDSIMKRRIPATLAAISTLALGAAACGSDDSSSSSSASSGSEPVAKVDALSGRSTAVTLDAGFVKALTTLKLTPSPVGDASISKQGVASFPITGGNVTYYK